VGVFLKNQCYDKKLAYFSFILRQKRHLFAQFFGENILKKTTSVPGHSATGSTQSKDSFSNASKVTSDGNEKLSEKGHLLRFCVVSSCKAENWEKTEVSSLTCTFAAGRPDWANYRLFGECLLWKAFLKTSQILPDFPSYKIPKREK
jgi:hypothetical protein